MEGWNKRMKGSVRRHYLVLLEVSQHHKMVPSCGQLLPNKNLLPVDGRKKIHDTILWRVHLRNEKIGFSIWRNKNENLKWDIVPKNAFFVIFAYLMNLLHCLKKGNFENKKGPNRNYLFKKVILVLNFFSKTYWMLYLRREIDVVNSLR